MLFGVVTGEAPAQVAVQGDGVQERLQRVVGRDHLGLEGVGPVVPGRQRLLGRAQLVRLVVGQEEAVAREAEHEVEAPRQVARGAPRPGQGRAGARRSAPPGRPPAGAAPAGRPPPRGAGSHWGRPRRPAGSRRSARRAGPGARCRRSRTPSTIGPRGLSMAAHSPDTTASVLPRSTLRHATSRSNAAPTSEARSRRVELGVLEHAVDRPCPPGRLRACRPAATPPSGPPRAGSTPLALQERRARPRPTSAVARVRSRRRAGRAAAAGDARVGRPAPADVERPVEDRRLELRWISRVHLPAGSRRQSRPARPRPEDPARSAAVSTSESVRGAEP